MTCPNEILLIEDEVGGGDGVGDEEDDTDSGLLGCLDVLVVVGSLK